jgi:hypothetical protein
MLCDWRHWWALQDLNLEPTDYESAALTLELRAQIILCLGLTRFSRNRFQRHCSRNCSHLGAFYGRRLPLCLRLPELRAVEIFEPFESPLQTFRRGVHVSLRDGHAAMSCDPHDGESIGAGFAKPRKHRMPQRMYHEVLWKLQRIVLVIERCFENWRFHGVSGKNPCGF